MLSYTAQSLRNDRVQWFKPHTPHVNVRALGDDIVMAARMVSSPGCGAGA